MYSEYNRGATRCAQATRHLLRHKYRTIVFLSVASLPISTAFSSPAARSALFSSPTRFRFTERQIPTAPTHLHIVDETTRRKNTQQSTVFSYRKTNLFPDFFPDVGVSRTDRIQLSLMNAAMFLAFAGLIYVSGPGSWRYFAAGGICAATSHAVTTPIDVVKVLIQYDAAYFIHLIVINFILGPSTFLVDAKAGGPGT